MSVIFVFIFWALFFLLLLVYLAFPVYLLICGYFARKPEYKEQTALRASLIILAGKDIFELKSKIVNCLSLDSVKGKMEVVVAVGERNAEVESAVLEFFSKGVKLFYPVENKTQAEMLVLCVTETKGEAVVVTDSASKLDRYAVKNILKKLSDESTGVVSGRTVFAGGDDDYRGGRSAAGIYRDRVLRLFDRAGLLPCADPALYAFRKSAVDAIPAGSNGHSAIPVRALHNGFASRYEPLAIAEKTLDKGMRALIDAQASEFAGKARSIRQAAELFRERKLNAAFAVLIDNVLKSWSGLFILLFFLLNIAIVFEDNLFIFLLALQVILLGAAFLRVSKILFFVVISGAASLKAVYLLWRDRNAG